MSITEFNIYIEFACINLFSFIGKKRKKTKRKRKRITLEMHYFLSVLFYQEHFAYD